MTPQEAKAERKTKRQLRWKKRLWHAKKDAIAMSILLSPLLLVFVLIMPFALYQNITDPHRHDRLTFERMANSYDQVVQASAFYAELSADCKATGRCAERMAESDLQKAVAICHGGSWRHRLGVPDLDKLDEVRTLPKWRSITPDQQTRYWINLTKAQADRAAFCAGFTNPYTHNPAI